MLNSRVKRIAVIAILSLVLILGIALAIVFSSRPSEPESAVGIDAHGHSEDIPLNKKGRYLHFDAEGYSGVKLSYSEQGEANGLYVVKVHVKRLSVLNSAKIKLDLGGSADINVNRVYGEVEISDTDEERSLEYIVKANGDGKISFAIELLGLKTAGVRTEIKKIEKINKYTVIEGAEGTVRMVFYKDDVKKLGKKTEDIQKLIDEYEGIRGELLHLTGDREPYQGTTDYLFTRSFDYYALAGDPIYVNRKQLVDATDGVTAELVHELSHTLDGITGSGIENVWNFDAEFMANLKMLYVMVKMGYFTEDDLKAYLDGIEHLNILKNGVYSSQSLTYIFVSGIMNIDENYIEHIENIYAYMLTELYKNGVSDDKFALFKSAFENEYGVELSSLFTEKEYSTVLAKHAPKV